MNSSFSRQVYSVTGNQSKNYLLLFILWPFLALVTALANYEQKAARRVVYFFLIYYGMTFFIPTVGYVDAAGYTMQLKANAALPFSDFFKIVGGIYAIDTSVDIVEPLISFIVSRFTEDHRGLFTAYAALFGFFFLKSINLLYDRYKLNPGWPGLIHLVFFAAILPITAINGFRMWTAAWIFFYGAYRVIIDHEPRYLIIALFSSLVHWSYISANAVLIIYFLAGNRNYIYLPLALLSFILPQLMTPYFNLIALRMGGAIQNRYDMYSGVDYGIIRQETAVQAAWFLKIGYDLVLYYLLLAIIVIQYKSKSLVKGKAEENLFSFLLLFLAFVNFGMAIPSFGGRFLTIFFMFATLYVFLYSIKLTGEKINPLSLIGLFPMLLYTAIVFRQGSDSLNAWIFAPGFGLPFFVPGLSVASLLF
jgi:hypothetical protein